MLIHALFLCADDRPKVVVKIRDLFCEVVSSVSFAVLLRVLSPSRDWAVFSRAEVAFAASGFYSQQLYSQ